jgi:hypothetical protein
MTEREMLLLIRSIVLARRRAQPLGYTPLTRALDNAGYYAGLKLGEKLATERKDPKP